jgi:hypothetical protein
MNVVSEWSNNEWMIIERDKRHVSNTPPPSLPRTHIPSNEVGEVVKAHVSIGEIVDT